MSRTPAAEKDTRGGKGGTDPGAVAVFVSYSRKDAPALARLQSHLAPLKRDGLKVWTDESIHPGGEIDREIPRALKAADIFLALVSSNYLDSHYCFDREYRYALGRRERRTMYVVAAIIRPCVWKRTSMARYVALPRNGRSVAEWPVQDKAYTDIVEGLASVIAKVKRGELEKRSVIPPKPTRPHTRRTSSPSGAIGDAPPSPKKKGTTGKAVTPKAKGRRRRPSTSSSIGTHGTRGKRK